MCSRTDLQKHFLVLGVIGIIGLSAQLFHICNKVPVADDLQEASLERDSQPVVFTKEETHMKKSITYVGICSLDVITAGLVLFLLYLGNCPNSICLMEAQFLTASAWTVVKLG